MHTPWSPSLAALLAALLLLATATHAAPKPSSEQQVLILSFDGFRYDYYDHFKDKLDSLTKLAQVGVHMTRGITPAFTTKTFPSHWSIATGLYEESHGIVGNSFYDPELKEEFHPRGPTTMDRKWWWGEPLWVTAKRQGKRVGVYMWVGSEVDFKDLNPDCGIIKYNSSVPLSYRYDTIADWLSGADGPKYDLVMSYWNQPDSVGHTNGPFSSKVEEALVGINENLRKLLDKLRERNVLDNLNIIITADHGMASTVKENVSFYLEDYVNRQRDIIYNDEAPVAAIWPRQGVDEGQLLSSLKVHGSKHNATSYAKEDIPERWHFKHGHRIPPILVVADEGHLVQNNDKSFKPRKGEHGYDNDLLSMRPIFFAAGPAFKKNHTADDPFELVNIYSLACHILGIEAAPNNGSLLNVRNLLVDGGCHSRAASDRVTNFARSAFVFALFSCVRSLLY